MITRIEVFLNKKGKAIEQKFVEMVIIIIVLSFFLFSEDFMKRFFCYSLLLVSSALLVVACKKDPIVEERKQTISPSDGSSDEHGKDDSSSTPEGTLTRIEIVSLPVQTTYLLHADTGLNLEGLVVEGIYDNGKRERLSVSADNILGFSTENVSEELPVTVVIDGKQASFTIKVVDYVIKDGVLTEVLLKEGEEYRLPTDVKVIASSAFASCSFNKIILNEGLEEIQADAFSNNPVKEIVFPESLKKIGEYCFYGCRNLIQLDLGHTQIKTIPMRALSNVAAETIVLPASLEEISSQSLLHTDNLHSITLPESLKKIGIEAFRESGLREVTLPNSIELIEERAFYLCRNLRQVKSIGILKQGVTGIMHHGIFQYCPDLSVVELPESVESVGQTLFSANVHLEALTLGRNLKHLAFNALGNSSVKVLTVNAPEPPSLEIYSLPEQVEQVVVPKGALQAYNHKVDNESLRNSWGTLVGRMKESN